MTASTVNPETLTWQGETEKYPFFADENSNITGYGHQDKKTFAEAIIRHDKEYWPDDPAAAIALDEDIKHIYVRDDAENELFIVCDAEDEGAYPVTTYWVAR